MRLINFKQTVSHLNLFVPDPQRAQGWDDYYGGAAVGSEDS
jgi:hypothetical protein